MHDIFEECITSETSAPLQIAQYYNPENHPVFTTLFEN
jgi:hypothetical protein